MIPNAMSAMELTEEQTAISTVASFAKLENGHAFNFAPTADGAYMITAKAMPSTVMPMA